MKQQKMTVLFYLNKAKTNQKGVCPIYCRITYNKSRKEFSTGLFINPSIWDSKQQSAKPPPDLDSYPLDQPNQNKVSFVLTRQTEKRMGELSIEIKSIDL